MMGRIIDADRLKRHYAWWNNDEQRTFDSIVDAQPTVEAIPVEWIQSQIDRAENYKDLLALWKEEQKHG
jgi:hypothetical protein